MIFSKKGAHLLKASEGLIDKQLSNSMGSVSISYQLKCSFLVFVFVNEKLFSFKLSDVVSSIITTLLDLAFFVQLFNNNFESGVANLCWLSEFILFIMIGFKDALTKLFDV